MKRKIVRQGAATMMVSLPSKWVKKVHLEKGDEVDIEELDGNLLISKEKIKLRKETTITVTNLTESAIRVVIWNAYRTGYDRIVVQFHDERQYAALKHTIKTYLIGFDITKKEKNHCIVENITEPSEQQFDVLFRKILQNISLLIRLTEERLQDKKGVEDYNELEDNILQYYNFCLRVIGKKYISGSEAILWWLFITQIAHGQRELYHLNRFLDSNRVEFRNAAFYENLKRIFVLLNDGYIKKDIPSLEQIHELEKKMLYKDFYSITPKNKKEHVILHHIASAIRNFYLASSPLMGLLLSSNTSK